MEEIWDAYWVELWAGNFEIRLELLKVFFGIFSGKKLSKEFLYGYFLKAFYRAYLGYFQLAFQKDSERAFRELLEEILIDF